MADVKMPDFTKINPKPAAANQTETKTGSATAPRSSGAVQMLPGGMPDFTKVDPEKLSVQPKISTLSRVGNTVLGAAKSTASGLANAGGTLLDIIRAADMRASQQNQNALQAAKNAEHYREMVQRGYMDDGTKLDEAGKTRLLMLADREEKSVTTNNQLNETLHEPIKQATQATQAKADDLAQSSEANISKAKKGLGAVGQTVVDVGVAGAQMLGDAAANAIVPGAGLAAMGARAFGSAAQEARLNGGTLGQQVGYGAAVAGVEMLTEKMFDGLAGIYGGGGADDVVKKAIDKLAKSKAGKDALTILSGMGGEALEEVVSGAIDPALKSIYDGEKMGSHYNAETASDILHSAIVGGILGGIGSGTTVLKGQNTPLDSKGNVNTKAEGNVTAKAENAAQTVTEPNAGVQAKTQTDPLAQAMFGESTQKNVENSNYVDGNMKQPYNETNKAGGALNGEQNGTGVPGNLGAGEAERSADGGIDRRTVEERDSAGSPGVSGELLSAKKLSDTQADNQSYSAYLAEAKMSDPANGWAVTQKSAEELAGDTKRIVGDGAMGYAVTKDGDLVAVFKNKNKMTGRNALRSLIPQAIADGAVKGDCYGERLMQLYAASGGAIPVARVEFAPEYANDGWNESKGHPYTYVFMFGGEKDSNGLYHVPTIEELNAIPTYGKDGYDDALAYRDSVLAGRQSGVAEDLPQSIGAAQSGFETPDSQSVERISSLASGVAAYNRYEGEATARSRAEYDELFKYRSQTEAQSLQQADNLLYVQQDGQRRFLMDVDREAFDDTVSYLESAPAWNGVMTDAAMLIKMELQGRSTKGEVSEDTYVAWLKTMHGHGEETGRGSQAWAKWTRRDNDAGQATELEAWDRLEKNDSLSDEQRRQIFQSVIKFDQRIESAKTDADLKSVILEIASQRGTTNGLTGKQSRILRFFAEKSLSSMDFAQLKQFAYQSASAMTTDGMDGDIGRKIKAIQVLNMLSNPKTPAKNLTGNTSFYGLDAMTMRCASIVDMALSKVTGTRSVAMESSLLTDSKARSDIAKAIRLSMAEVTMDVDMGGGNRYQSGRSRTFKASGNIVDRILSACERNMAYALNTTDEAYKGAARATEHNTQKLIDEGKIKTNNADYAAEQAQNLAEYRTFQGHGKIATAIQTVHDVLNLIGVGNSGQTLGPQELTVHSFGVGDLVAPFTRVAGNLAGVGVDYSPINAVKGTVEVIDCIRKGVTNLDVDPAAQSKAVSDMARGLTGSALAYGVAAIAKAGIIRRADDEGDKDVASLNQSEGMRGTQINIDAAKRWIDGGDGSWKNGDTLVDLSNLEPINFIVSLGVELSDNEDTDGIVSKFTDVSLYKDTAKSAVETAADLPILQTVGDYAKDVMVYHNDPIRAAAEALGKSAISSVTPNAIAMFAKGKDDKQRSTYSEDELTSVLRDTFKSRIPGLRETLPTTVNTLGEEKPNPGTTAERIFNAMLNPIGVNEYSQSAVSQEMTRVRDKTGIVDFYPTTRKPSEVKYTDKNGNEHKVELSYEQKQKYQATASAAQMTTTAELIGSAAYKSANADMQAKLLKRCLDYSNQYAKAQILGKDSVDKWVLNSQTAKKDIGLSQSEYFYYYEKYGGKLFANGDNYEKTKRAVASGMSIDQYAAMKANIDADGNGSVSQAEAQTYLDSTDLSKDVKYAMWNVIKASWKKNPYG